MIALSALVLCACQPHGPGGKPAASPDDPLKAAPPPMTAAQIGGDIDARGTEPFWSLKIRGTQMTLSRAGAPDLVATVAAPVLGDAQAAWSGQSADGQTIKATVYVSDCTDGMGDRTYPLAAQVELTQLTQLSGCAARPASAPKGVAAR
ncbi:hypothetical protein DJ021_07340 [Phenylobacterium hankyongense]|uniref:Uncharacterized protein n=1 Tax=Phenylobacterium hankyongense TaxID=1813876 RepID=A0A328AY98_9CAUL|nr:hypothetical protein DJ021_07340 [Phenylobacterium hankyongense]